MVSTDEPPERFLVGSCTIDLATGEITRENVTRRLQDKPLMLLVSLMEHVGKVVDRETLRRRLWPDDTHVDFDNNLNASVKKLRDALGDIASCPAYIETLPRKGYRLIAEVTPIPPKNTTARTRTRSMPGWPLLAAVTTALVLAAVWAVYSRAPVAMAPVLPEGKIMLAVLPFQNVSGHAEDDYFCDGLTEELIAHLGRLQPERLGVISRISAMAYKQTQKSARQIGNELGTHYLIEGSARRDRSRWRITVQLVQVRDQTHLWAESYELDQHDIFELQQDVSSQVARDMSLQLMAGDVSARVRASTMDGAAYDSYLKGRYEWFRFSNPSFRAAERHFLDALEHDPGFAHAYAGLADTYNLMPLVSF